MNISVKLPVFREKEYNILDFGAKSDNEFNNKTAIQNAIDECNSKGGGKVIIPDGFYITGPIELKSNVNLYVSENAFVKFTKSEIPDAAKVLIGPAEIALILMFFSPKSTDNSLTTESNAALHVPINL